MLAPKPELETLFVSVDALTFARAVGPSPATSESPMIATSTPPSCVVMRRSPGPSGRDESRATNFTSPSRPRELTRTVWRSRHAPAKRIATLSATIDALRDVPRDVPMDSPTAGVFRLFQLEV